MGSSPILLNHPTRSMKRYELLRALHDVGINSHNAYRSPKEDFLKNTLFLYVVLMIMAVQALA